MADTKQDRPHEEDADRDKGGKHEPQDNSEALPAEDEAAKGPGFDEDERADR